MRGQTTCASGCAMPSWTRSRASGARWATPLVARSTRGWTGTSTPLPSSARSALDTWLASLHDAADVVARLDEAFHLALGAPRAAARWPGHKALVATLGEAPPVVATRFGVPVFDVLATWAATKEPPMREIVAAAIRSRKLAGRFGPEVARVEAALRASEPAPRNPDHDVGPTRDRSKNRRRGRR